MGDFQVTGHFTASGSIVFDVEAINSDEAEDIVQHSEFSLHGDVDSEPEGAVDVEWISSLDDFTVEEVT